MEFLKQLFTGFISILVAIIVVGLAIGLAYFGALLGLVITVITCVAALGYCVFEYIHEGRNNPGG